MKNNPKFGWNSRWDSVEEIFSELEIRSGEVFQIIAQRDKEMETRKENLRDLEVTLRNSNF